MSSKRVLVVKMSSLGDVVHTLPAVSDACAHGAQIDWVVEEAFADIPALHPGVVRVLPIAWRRWRRNLRQSNSQMRQFRDRLREQSYDVVIDSQGLIKSAVVTLMARGCKQGFSHRVAREPLAAFAYSKGHVVARGQHAIDRQRQLFAAALGYELETEIYSGLEKAIPSSKQVVLLHGTTWRTKHWPRSMWQNLAELVQADGYEAVVTWGNAEERVHARAIADATGATILDRLALRELVTVLAKAAAVIGVDSGLCHLSAALGAPTLGLYGPTDGQLTGCRGQYAQFVQASTPCSPCLQDRCYQYPGAPLQWREEIIEPPCFATLTPQLVWQRTRALREAKRQQQKDGS